MTLNGSVPDLAVLIVDDDPDAHFLLKRQLGRLGASLVIQSILDGYEAVRHLEQCASGAKPFPSLLFLDIKMPGTSGFDVLGSIRSRELLGRMTVVMLSSSDEPRDVSRAMSLGAHSYLTKPPSTDLLVELVNSCVRLGSRKAATLACPPRRVLVVDDSSFARRTTRGMLEKLGLEVLDAADGPTALSLLREHTPDVVLLDLMMTGGMSGFDVLAGIRAAASNVKVVIVTADTQHDTAQHALAAGASSVLHKPLSAEKIAAALALP